MKDDDREEEKTDRWWNRGKSGNAAYLELYDMDVLSQLGYRSNRADNKQIDRERSEEVKEK